MICAPIIPMNQLFGTREGQSSLCIQTIASVNTQSLEATIRRCEKLLFIEIQRIKLLSKYELISQQNNGG